MSLCYGALRCLLDEIRAIKVWESLTEIDRLVLCGETAHRGEDRLPEWCESRAWTGDGVPSG
jgi:hypothetical protein